MGAGCFKAFTFSDYSRDEDIKSVSQKMFTKLETGTCYRVKMAPLAGGTTSDAYVYCASGLFGVIHLQNHEGANYYGRLYNGTWTWDSYALKSDLSDRAKKLSANFTPGNTVLDVSSWSVITLLSIVTYKDESTALYLLRKESSSKIYCIPVKSSTQVSVTYNGENKLILTNSATYGGTYTVLFLS